MMKRVCLLVSVLAVLPSIGVESARVSDFRIKEFEQKLLSAINRGSLTDIKHQLKGFAHVACSSDEKKKLFDALICTAEDKVQELSQHTSSEDLLFGATFGMGALFLYQGYSAYKAYGKFSNMGYNLKRRIVLLGVMSAMSMSGSMGYMFEKNNKITTMKLICEALEDAKNASTITTTSKAKK
jgi:hypothetical protein